MRTGEFFGIAGRNGSGKSTLLKCLAGIYGVDTGQIWMHGRLSPFIELGVGFNQDLAARDNVVLNGIMMGLTPREARARYDAVIDFAELREFEELKLKNYSSGMHVRLAFSVAIQVDADILLVDEVLAVGDAAFQQKCFDVFNRMRDEGRTIVFVTHDMGTLNRFCHRAMLLEKGSMVHLGEPHEVADRYLEINFGRDPEAARTPARSAAATARPGSSRPGSRTSTASATSRCPRASRSPSRRSSTSRSTSTTRPRACTCSTRTTSRSSSPRRAHEHERSGNFSAGEEVLFSFTFENVLAPGRYNPLFTLAHRGTGLDLIDRFEGAFSFVVTGPEALGGRRRPPGRRQRRPRRAASAPQVRA